MTAGPARALIVMRHAKSSWAEEGLDDHARPLNKRGRRDAPAVAARLLSLGLAPSAVWSSDAQRTRETWSGVAPIFADAGLEPAVHFTPSLYLAGLSTVRALASRWSTDLDQIMLLGHNPGWEDMVSLLSDMNVRLTTGNAAVLRGAGTTWSRALEQPWELVELIRPRELS